MNEEEIERLTDQRNSLRAEKRKLQTDATQCRTKIKDLDKRIEMEVWDMRRINGLIKAKGDELAEVEKQLFKEKRNA